MAVLEELSQSQSRLSAMAANFSSKTDVFQQGVNNLSEIIAHHQQTFNQTEFNMEIIAALDHMTLQRDIMQLVMAVVLVLILIVAAVDIYRNAKKKQLPPWVRQVGLLLLFRMFTRSSRILHIGNYYNKY